VGGQPPGHFPDAPEHDTAPRRPAGVGPHRRGDGVPTVLPHRPADDEVVAAALAIILFLFQWNLFLFPLVILGQDKYTIPVAISDLIGAQRVYYDQIMVAAGLSIVPIFLLFLFLQKYFVSGILAGSVKE